MVRLVTDNDFNGKIARGFLRLRPTADLIRVQDLGMADIPDPNLLASAGRMGPAEVGRGVGCTARAGGSAIRASEAGGLGCLTAKPPRPSGPRPGVGRRRVGRWSARHGRRVSREKKGGRIRVCGVPLKAP